MDFDDEDDPYGDENEYEGYHELDESVEEESARTGLPVGYCGYCGGAHYITEHMTDGEIAHEARDAERDDTPEPPDDWPDGE